MFPNVLRIDDEDDIDDDEDDVVDLEPPHNSGRQGYLKLGRHLGSFAVDAHANL